jgi:hypothetical protein
LTNTDLPAEKNYSFVQTIDINLKFEKMTPVLAPKEEVFFVHYQCDYFEDGNRIHDLHIYAKGRLKEYTGPDEAHFLKRYADRVQELSAEGLTLVHWNQNRPYYGPDHINERYKELTGQELNLDYCNEINLAEKLKDIYGDNYVCGNTSRLNTLAELNHFNGHLEKDKSTKRVLHSNRTLLLYRIYRAVTNNTLIVERNGALPSGTPKTTKLFSDYLLHHNREAFAAALRNEFSTEKSKKLRLLTEAMLAYNPALLSICSRERKAFYNAMKDYFARDIGCYNSIFDCDYNPEYDRDLLEPFTLRLTHLLE